MMHKKTGALLALLGVLVAAPVFAFRSIGEPAGHINDFADIIPEQTEIFLEERLQNFEKEDGAEVAVVTVPSLEEDTIENYAVELFADWGIGKASVDNGVLLLVAPNERELRIEVGYGLEGNLTDALSHQIIQNDIIPSFKNDDYPEGIVAGVESITQAVQGVYDPSMFDEAKKSIPWGDMILWIGLFVLYVGVWIFVEVAKALADSHAIWPGGLLGLMFGLFLGLFLVAAIGVLFWLVISIGLGLIGLFIDYLFSRNEKMNKRIQKMYKKHEKERKQHGFWGGFFGGGSSSGGSSGFGGFGGGMSGGGGSSGRW